MKTTPVSLDISDVRNVRVEEESQNLTNILVIPIRFRLTNSVISLPNDDQNPGFRLIFSGFMTILITWASYKNLVVKHWLEIL